MPSDNIKINPAWQDIKDQGIISKGQREDTEYTEMSKNLPSKGLPSNQHRWHGTEQWRPQSAEGGVALIQTGEVSCGPASRSPPANAGDTGLIPGPEGFHTSRSNYAHAPQQLAHTLQLTTEARTPPSLCSAPREVPLLVATRENTAQQQRPSTAKNKWKNKIK